MLLALLPSRDTPQARRSSSNGTKRPKWARTMASAAAPHSTASIWRTVGVRAGRPARFGAPDRRGAILQTPSFSRAVGMIRLTGRCSLTMTLPVDRVPLLIFRLGPRDEDQR